MPDAVVDYNLSNAKWTIVQQENILLQRTRALYGTRNAPLEQFSPSKNKDFSVKCDGLESSWNSLLEYYACEQYEVPSHDVTVPLTVVYSHKLKQDGQNPGLLHGHGSYGELLDKRWRSEQKSLLDRGWVIAYADVRYVIVFIFIFILLLWFLYIKK